MAGYFRYEETYMRRRGRCTKILDREVGCDLKSSPHTHGRTYSNSPARPQPTNTNGNHLREREREREIPKTLGRWASVFMDSHPRDDPRHLSRMPPRAPIFFASLRLSRIYRHDIVYAPYIASKWDRMLTPTIQGRTTVGLPQRTTLRRARRQN